MLKTLFAAALLASAAASARSLPLEAPVEPHGLVLRADHRPWVLAPRIYVEPGLMGPRQVRRILRARGFRGIQIGRPAGEVYRVRAVDRHGNQVSLTLSAYSGEILKARLAAEERERQPPRQRTARNLRERAAPKGGEAAESRRIARAERPPERLPAARPDIDEPARVASLQQDVPPPKEETAPAAPAAVEEPPAEPANDAARAPDVAVDEDAVAGDEAAASAGDEAPADAGEASVAAEEQPTDEAPMDGPTAAAEEAMGDEEAPVEVAEGEGDAADEPAADLSAAERAIRVIPLERQAPSAVRPAGPSDEAPTEETATDETATDELPGKEEEISTAALQEAPAEEGEAAAPTTEEGAAEAPSSAPEDETTIAALEETPAGEDDAAATEDEPAAEGEPPSLPLALEQAEILVEPPETAPLPRARPAIVATVADEPTDAPSTGEATEGEERDPLVINNE